MAADGRDSVVVESAGVLLPMLVSKHGVFTVCFTFAATPAPLATDPCNPSPCGPNAVCRDGSCSCLPEYSGNPYEACRPECVVNPECPRDRACLRNKCRDPCPGTCGANARCDVVNHIPVCSCPEGYTGDPFSNCRLAPQRKSTLLSQMCNIHILGNE